MGFRTPDHKTGLFPGGVGIRGVGPFKFPLKTVVY